MRGHLLARHGPELPAQILHGLFDLGILPEVGWGSGRLDDFRRLWTLEPKPAHGRVDAPFERVDRNLEPSRRFGRHTTRCFECLDCVCCILLGEFGVSHALKYTGRLRRMRGRRRLHKAGEGEISTEFL